MEERSNSNLRHGIWTPTASIVCYACHGNEGPRALSDEQFQKMLEPRPLQPGNAQTFCDSCGADVQVSRGLAAEHNLVRELREQGIDAIMVHVGGGLSACLVGVAPELRKPPREGELGLGQVLITCGNTGECRFTIAAYDVDYGPAAYVSWGNVTCQSADEILEWAESNRDKLRTLDVERKRRPRRSLAAMMREAVQRTEFLG